jgi:sugar/nucleoside kinase (ribokinase family)
LSAVGDDRFGDELLSGLGVAGVDTRSVIRTKGDTPTTIALVKSDGNRLFLHKPGVSLQAFPEPVEFTPLLLHGMSHYHLANPFSLPAFRPYAAETLRRARTAGLKTSLDAAWDSLGRWFEDMGACRTWTRSSSIRKRRTCSRGGKTRVKRRGLLETRGRGPWW